MEEGEGWRVGENEGPTTTKGERRKWIGGREEKGRGRDLPDQCQTASYAPVKTTQSIAIQ